MIKVTVVVPIYNVELYLDRCLKTLTEQTLEDIEIVLIDDGSTDDSFAICCQYASKDSRIKLVRKKNGGVSSARNLGLSVASGDYIGFVDPDDWIEKNMYESLYYEVIMRKADVIMCNFYRESAESQTKVNLPFENTFFSKKHIDSVLIPNMLSRSDSNDKSETIMGSVWRLLVKREILIKNNIHFDEDIPFMEDFIWCIEVLQKSNSIAFKHDHLYHYRQTNQSASRKYIENLHEIQMIVFNKISTSLVIDSIEIQRKMDLLYYDFCLTSIVNECKKANSNNIKDIFYKIKLIVNDKSLESIMSSENFTIINFKRKVLNNLIRCKLSILLFLYYRIKVI